VMVDVNSFGGVNDGEDGIELDADDDGKSV
jgi:hypothetical protein